MLGSQPCKDKKWEGAVETITFTGIDKKQVVCNISSPGIKHFLQVRNFRAYETRIKCISQITSIPRFIKFESPDKNVMEDRWEAECTLNSSRPHTFSHVTVSSEHLGTGDQIIKVTLEIDRLRGIKEMAALQITVSS